MKTRFVLETKPQADYAAYPQGPAGGKSTAGVTSIAGGKSTAGGKSSAGDKGTALYQVAIVAAAVLLVASAAFL